MGRSCGGRHYDHETDTGSEVTADGQIRVTLDESGFDFADNITSMKDSLEETTETQADLVNNTKDVKEILEETNLLMKKMETHLSLITDENIKEEDINGS